MITIFVMELAAGISGYVLRNEAGQMLKGNLQTTMKDYKQYQYIAVLWDEVQRDVYNIQLPRLMVSYKSNFCYSSHAVAWMVLMIGCRNRILVYRCRAAQLIQVDFSKSVLIVR